MDDDRARGDRKPEAVTANGAVACGVHSVERLEDELQILLGNAGAVVTDDYFDTPSVGVPRVNTNLRAGRRITHRVANDVLHRTAQQLGVTADLERPVRLQSNT